MSNIAIANGPVEIVDLPIKMMIFHGYVSLPEGNYGTSPCYSWERSRTKWRFRT